MNPITSDKLFQIGHEISEILIKNKVSFNNTLTLTVNEKDFTKIDEDLFYRNVKDNTQEFIPSFSEINIKFPCLIIKIKKES